MSVVRQCGPDDRDQSWALGRLAFGGDPAAEPPPPSAGRLTYGLFDGPRLLAKASILAYEQCWGGLRVPMAGVAGVAVHPDARGRGHAGRLLQALLPVMAEQQQVVSALFPTAIGLYRRHGWEVVGELTRTRLRAGDLRVVRPVPGVTVRTAGPDDVPGIGQLWTRYAAEGNGLLTRDGPQFPRGATAVLEADVVALAEVDGAVLGYVSYDRGRGYGAGAAVQVYDFVALHEGAAAALVHSLGTWASVVEAVIWRGPVDQLTLLLGTPVPPAQPGQPWMLRIVNPAGAVAARGFATGAAVEVDLILSADDSAPAGWHLSVDGGRGSLTAMAVRDGLPVLHPRGLALLYAAAADTALLRRAGLLRGDLPGVDAAFAGPAPVILDYF